MPVHPVLTTSSFFRAPALLWGSRSSLHWGMESGDVSYRILSLCPEGQGDKIIPPILRKESCLTKRCWTKYYQHVQKFFNYIAAKKMQRLFSFDGLSSWTSQGHTHDNPSLPFPGSWRIQETQLLSENSSWGRETFHCPTALKQVLKSNTS